MEGRRSDIHAGQSPVMLIRNAVGYPANPMTDSRRTEEYIRNRRAISPSGLAVGVEVVSEGGPVQQRSLSTRGLVAGRKPALGGQRVCAGEVVCAPYREHRALTAVYLISQPQQTVRQTLQSFGSVAGRGIAGNQVQGELVAEPVFERPIAGVLVVPFGRTRRHWKGSLHSPIPIRVE